MSKLNVNTFTHFVNSFLSAFKNKLFTVHISAKLSNMYEDQPDKIYPFLPRFVQYLSEDDEPMHIYVLMMIVLVAKKSPQVRHTAA